MRSASRAVRAALAIGGCIIWTGACASVEGLSQYSTVSGDGSVTVTQDVAVPGDDGSAVDDNAQVPDAPGSDDVVDPADGSGMTDVGTPPMDASSGDAAPPPCNSTSCNGCCINGVCSGGNSVATCGRHGAQCTDCTSHGGACNSGVCGTKPADSGTTTTGQCTSTSTSGCGPCSGTAIYNTCCKSDHTCGCQFTFFAPCT